MVETRNNVDGVAELVDCVDGVVTVVVSDEVEVEDQVMFVLKLIPSTQYDSVN